jgi:ArsR family metal-binding transcriptional regulator
MSCVAGWRRSYSKTTDQQREHTRRLRAVREPDAPNSMNQTDLDDADLLMTTCPSQQEFDRLTAALDRIGVPYRRVDPTPPLARVAVPGLVVPRDARGLLVEANSDAIVSGWIDYRHPTADMPSGPEPEGIGACFESATIMVLQPCVADETKIRLTAHVRGDLGPAFPYLNAVMATASYIPSAEVLNFMDKHRMVALYRRRITIAKADDIVDAWLTLARIRRLVEETWAKRDQIEPMYVTRKKPPAIEIFRRLPGTNCGLCGDLTCMAFAARLWTGQARVRQCSPVFLPGQEARRMALLDVCSALGVLPE